MKIAGADLAERNPYLVVPGTNYKLAPAASGVIKVAGADLAKRNPCLVVLGTNLKLAQLLL
jgi:hypothetical protein